jgi:transposase-like protein
MPKTFTVDQFFKRFPDDETCIRHLFRTKYGETMDCPKCKKRGKFSKLKNQPAFQCSWCGYQIHPMVGTPFEKSRTPLQKWFYAMYLFTTSRHGVPAKELERQLGVTYKTAWRMGHEIRKYMGKTDGEGPFYGHVEADETYMGGKPRNGDGRKGRGTKKTAVFGLAERDGRIMTKIVPNVGASALHKEIWDNVVPGSRVSTDEWKSYKGLNRLGYKHETVNHSREEWARGDVHTNNLENFWSRVKNSIRGTHIHVSKKHLQKYLVEFEFRYNMRGEQARFMFDRLLVSF